MIPEGGNRFPDKIMPTEKSLPVSVSEANALFSDLSGFPVLLLAVSGGPDSTALMMLMARWRAARKSGPRLIAVTVDHGLRAEAKREAAAVARLARKLKLSHRTLRWTGVKPKTGLQEAARNARYRLLAAAARQAGASHILTAHTRDDQAETFMMRMSRGSGLTGLASMRRLSELPAAPGLRLVRPLLGIPKARLLATLKAARIPYADDPSNRDPRFTRARFRKLMEALAAEGLGSDALALLVDRLARAADALAAAAERLADEMFIETAGPPRIALETARFAALPDEFRLRLIGRAIDRVGDEGPVELGKLEALKCALDAALLAKTPFRRSLAGALVTLCRGTILVETAPPRRSKTLTTRRAGAAAAAKTR